MREFAKYLGYFPQLSRVVCLAVRNSRQASFRGSLSLSADVGCTKKKDLLRPPLVVVSTRAAEDKNVVRDIDVRREEYLELCDRRNRGLSDKKTNPHEYAHVRLLGG